MDPSTLESELAGTVEALAGGAVLDGPSLAALGLLARDTFGARGVGLVWDRLSAARGEAHVDVTPDLHQPAGIVHGGVWCTVVESMASVMAMFHALRDGRTVVGVHNATDFLRPVDSGRVDGVATPVQVGRTQQLWLVELTRTVDGRAVARGQIRLAAVEPGAR